MVDQEFKGVAPPTLSELCGGLWIQNDPAQVILKDEPKMKIIFFSGSVSLWTAKISEKESVYISFSQNLLAFIQVFHWKLTSSCI